MEESKDLITAYKIFRSLVYVSVILEFFMYAIDPQMLDFWGGILCDIHSRMKRWFIYNDGNLIWSKTATLLAICITCIGTRNRKALEFDARRMVLYPLVSGIFIIAIGESPQEGVGLTGNVGFWIDGFFGNLVVKIRILVFRIHFNSPSGSVNFICDPCRTIDRSPGVTLNPEKAPKRTRAYKPEVRWMPNSKM